MLNDMPLLSALMPTATKEVFRKQLERHQERCEASATLTYLSRCFVGGISCLWALGQNLQMTNVSLLASMWGIKRHSSVHLH